MATFNLTIVSAERKIFEGEVKQIRHSPWTHSIANGN